MRVKRKLTPHQRIVNAFKQGRGVQLRKIVKKRVDVWFIEEEDFGMLSHSRTSAHQWLDCLLYRLKSGDGEAIKTICFQYKSMSQAELNSLPDAD